MNRSYLFLLILSGMYIFDSAAANFIGFNFYMLTFLYLLCVVDVFLLNWVVKIVGRKIRLKKAVQ